MAVQETPMVSKFDGVLLKSVEMPALLAEKVKVLVAGSAADADGSTS